MKTDPAWLLATWFGCGHVPKGPGIVLVGVKALYSFDLTDPAPGLLYISRRGLAGSAGQRFKFALRHALELGPVITKNTSVPVLNFNLVAEVAKRVRDDHDLVVDDAAGTTAIRRVISRRIQGRRRRSMKPSITICPA